MKLQKRCYINAPPKRKNYGLIHCHLMIKSRIISFRGDLSTKLKRYNRFIIEYFRLSGVN